MGLASDHTPRCSTTDNPLDGWTAERIEAECASAHTTYANELRARHIDYFASHPERRSRTMVFASRTRRAAFPDEWGHLAGALPARAWHRHHLSGASSQVLALALLASAIQADPSLQWLPGDWTFRSVLSLFEVELAPWVLNEEPRQTSLDWLILDTGHVIAGEAKFTERGLGRCSCELRSAGHCSARVLERPYWDVASREMGLEREMRPCGLSLVYQAVRNVAAAQAIAAERRAAFLLVYDERNPYFAGVGHWPGWGMMLARLMRDSATVFRTLSWQELLVRVDCDPRVLQWAAEKHGLEAQ